VINCSLNRNLKLLNTLKAELNPICHLLALLGAYLIFHVSRIRVNVKGKVIAVYAMKANKGNRGIAPFILYLGTRWW
jgi:hypothetical protein